MKRLTRTIAAIVLAVGAATLATSVPAQADEAAQIARAKTEITKRIDLRLGALAKALITIDSAKVFTASHASALKAIVNNDTSGLTTLKGKVAAETTLPALRTDAASMVNDYRIFLLVAPQIRGTLANDREAAVNDKLQKVHDKLADLLAKAKGAGKDTADAEKDLAAMQAALDKQKSDLAGQIDLLLGLTPGPDGPALTAKIDGVRQSLLNGRVDLHNAVASAKKVRDFLKSIKPTPSASPSA